LSIINHVTLQKIVAHDFRYDPRISYHIYIYISNHTYHVITYIYIYYICIYIYIYHITTFGCRLTHYYLGMSVEINLRARCYRLSLRCFTTPFQSKFLHEDGIL
jgi:hypothetical protein